MFLLFLVLVLIMLSELYKRHCPVLGVEYIQHVESAPSKSIIVDVRDYQTAMMEPIGEAIHIPVAYLKRNQQTIEKKPIHLIASNAVDKNLSIRFLKQKKFNVESYSIVEENL